LVQGEEIEMITGKDVGEKVKLEGIVENIRKPYIRITYARFECPSCGTIIGVTQGGRKLRDPKRCSCGRRGGFKILETDKIEGQDIFVLEKGTDFGYVVFLEEQDLIRKLTKIQEGCAVEVKGSVDVHYPEKSAIGDLIIFATGLKQIKRKKK
jgi:predicted RNA-binding Zn-ribbon protein involved in translation (DUF1610 family)